MAFTAPEGTPSMHSHDRTLLAKLGFADPDRKEPLHDLACQYLGRPEMAQRVLSAAFPKNGPRTTKAKKEIGPHGTYPRCEEERKEWAEYGTRVAEQEITVTSVFSGIQLRKEKTCFEQHVTKGEGKYATTVGFLDLVIMGLEIRRNTWIERRQIRAVSEYIEHGNRSHPDHRYRIIKPAVDTEYPGQDSDESDFTLIIEVKITPTSASDVIRQLKLYKEHYPRERGERLAFALITTYTVDLRDREMLANEGILAFQLGQEFDAWVKAKPDTADAPPVVVF